MQPSAPATHVVGLGLAGLSTALRLVAAGRPVRLYEAAGQAGGRCRSFHDARLGIEIDNGNHLLLSGNASALAYLDLVGARDEIEIGAEAAFPFVDLASGERWTVRINDGPLPWWLLDRRRRVPAARAAEYLSVLRIVGADEDATVTDAVGAAGALFRRFWEPLTIAVLNMPPTEGSARLMRTVLLATFARGGRHCRPVVARRSLGAAFVEPALARLADAGARPRFHCRLRGLATAGDRVAGLDFGGETVPVAADETVVLALPPSRLADALPGTTVPDDEHVIANAHFRIAPELAARRLPRLLGVLNGAAQWIFVRRDVISITISAAGALGHDGAAEELLPRLWAEARQALELPPDGTYLASRFIKEKRATFDQSPAGVRRRPKTATAFGNLFVAGDAVDTGLPATIEGAIRSGEVAANAILNGSRSWNFLAS